MQIIIIVAMTSDRLIGKEGRLPWHEPEDLKHFKRTTVGHAVIMGRRTFDSIAKPLAGRRNIVITRDQGYAPSAAKSPADAPRDSELRSRTTLDIVHSLDEAVGLCRKRGEEKAFIVGGAQIYALAMPVADELIVTTIDRPGLVGDTYFPEWDAAIWDESDISRTPSLRIMSYKRRR